MRQTIEITREDFLKFNKHILLKTRFKRSFIIASIFIIFWIIILNINQPLNFKIIIIEIVIFYLAWGVLIYVFYQLSFQRIKRMPDQNGIIIGKKTYIIQDNGFKEITDSSETITKWNGIKTIEETKDYIYVFVDKIAAYIIPKRSFIDETEGELFIKILKSKIVK